MQAKVVVAATGVYSAQDPRYIVNRIAEFMVNSPTQSLIERSLEEVGLRPHSCVSTVESTQNGNVLLIEFDLVSDAAAEHRNRKIRAAIDAVGSHQFVESDLSRAKVEAVKILYSTVGGMNEYLDATCGFLVDSGCSDSLSSFVGAIERCTLQDVTGVIADIYRGSQFVIDDAQIGAGAA